MPRHSDLRFTFTPEASQARFDVIEFDLDEGLSQPFVLRLGLSSHDPDVDFDGLLDHRALFTLWRGENPVRHVHGLISSLGIGNSGFRRTRYEAVVEPQWARLGLCSDWRIFQGLSAPQIIDRILDQHRVIDREQRLIQPHAIREYCVQAGETDLQFVSRLAAEEGLHYRFEHGERSHRLVLTDHISQLGQIGPDEARSVLYQGNSGGNSGKPAITRFAYTEQVRTARQVQRDYTFVQPRNFQHQQFAARDLEHQHTAYERYDYPGRYTGETVGKAFTETRLLALRNDARQAKAVGDDARLQPGLGFHLAEHPREAFNTYWRAVSLQHQGTQFTSQEEDASTADQGASYTQTALLVGGFVDWKAPLSAKPRIDGTHTATITGPPGEEIYCDEWGRVKVSFPWDRDSKQDDTSSCWIRVSQGWAGASWGAMAIPRVGQEVLVGFHNGDPDQPIVLGRTYRADNRPPYELPKHKTRMTLRSQSHKGDGFNELRFEDELGQEEVFIHAQKDQNNVIRHNETTEIGHDRQESVGHDEHVRVGNDQSVHIGGNRALVIGYNDTVQIVRDRREVVGNCRYDSTTADHKSSVGGNLEQQIHGQHTLAVDQGISASTTTYQLLVSERLVIKGPGGSITLDAEGIHLEGLAINIRGPLSTVSNGKGQEIAFQNLADPASACREAPE
jgi:type VI secretion system secreted protein VgrG